MTGNAADGTTGSPLRQRMIDQMRIANLAESTRITYIGEIEHLARHYKASPGRPRRRPGACLGPVRHPSVA